MYTNNSSLKYLVKQPMLGAKIYRCLLLFEEYDFEVIVKPRCLNVRVDHLSWIENGDEPTILEEGLLDVKLLIV